jgi:hypothetical protein
MQDCERALGTYDLGMKTCDWTFLKYAKIYETSGFPIIAIVRDIRDALVRPLPHWVTEATLNQRYHLIWRNLERFDLWIRYEELVLDPAKTMQKISRVLSHELKVLEDWVATSVQAPMLKLDRHELLKSGKISKERIGIWKTSGMTLSRESHETARMMGY